MAYCPGKQKRFYVSFTISDKKDIKIPIIHNVKIYALSESEIPTIIRRSFPLHITKELNILECNEIL